MKKSNITYLSISNHRLSNVKVNGNMLTYSAGEHEGCFLKIFDPTGSHGAENAYAVICEDGVPQTESELIDAIESLEEKTNGQFEVIEFFSTLLT